MRRTRTTGVTFGACSRFTACTLLGTVLFGAECRLLLDDAQKAFAARDANRATATLEKALGVCHEKAPVHVSLGQMHFLAGKEAEAEAQFKAAADLNSTAGMYALGRLYYQQHRYPEAVGQFLNVVAMEPANYRAHDNLGVCYDALRRDADAARHFRRALDLVAKDHPDYDWAYANFADFFLRRDRYDEAFQLAAEAAKRDPKSARNALLTGKALVKLGKQDLALRWLEQAVKLDDNYSEAWYLLSRTWRSLGDLEKADAALEKFKRAKASAQPQR